MHASNLFDQLRTQYGFNSDREVGNLLGLTAGRISQLRTNESTLSVRQISSFIKRASDSSKASVISNAILPVVEMYGVRRTESRQDRKWELLPTSKTYVRNAAIRKYLENVQGVYVFFDSQVCAIYVGKTERGNLWDEMTNAFNRPRSNHKVFLVEHPTIGKSFSPASEKLRQPKPKSVFLYDTAHYFSAYEVQPKLISKLEALLVRTFCNTLTNKKMETFS